LTAVPPISLLCSVSLPGTRSLLFTCFHYAVANFRAGYCYYCTCRRLWSSRPVAVLAHPIYQSSSCRMDTFGFRLFNYSSSVGCPNSSALVQHPEQLWRASTALLASARLFNLDLSEQYCYSILPLVHSQVTQRLTKWQAFATVFLQTQVFKPLPRYQFLSLSTFSRIVIALGCIGSLAALLSSAFQHFAVALILAACGGLMVQHASFGASNASRMTWFRYLQLVALSIVCGAVFIIGLLSLSSIPLQSDIVPLVRTRFESL